MRRALKITLPVIAVIMLLFAFASVFNKPGAQTAKPASVPPTSTHDTQIAGIGIAEPQSENIYIGTNTSGIVTKVYVKAGDRVKEGTKLFSIDNRELTAKLNQMNAELEMSKIESEEASRQLGFYDKLEDKRALSQEEFAKKQYAAQLADAKVKSLEADVSLVQTQLDKLTVTAPIAGSILKLDIRLGEYAETGTLTNPLIVMGDIDVMNVRVEIDETDALRVTKSLKAYGELRGYGKNGPIALKFVKFEPLMKAKKSLTGDGGERVDTRMMQVVYSFDNAKVKALVGQQMDVFIY